MKRLLAGVLVSVSFLAVVSYCVEGQTAAAVTITACVKPDGTTRILVAPGDSCKRTETAVSWNMEGPPGPAGPKGEPGDQGWYQTLPASERFVSVLNDQAVLDKETGLVWDKSPQATEPHPTWFEALAHCASRTVGGRMGWRLPALQELASLIDPSVAPGPTLPSGHPFLNVQAAGYWSATTHAEFSELVRVVSFYDGTVANGTKDGLAYAWCVRGGKGLDAQ